VNLDRLAQKVDGFLYHRLMQNLSEGERSSAKSWCFQMIKRNNPQFTPEQIQKYYDSLDAVRSYAVDREGRRI
jgi:hypothetical protein